MQRHIFTARRYASALYAVVVCLSVWMFAYVCVSVTLRYCIKKAEHGITQTKPHDSPWGTLVFLLQRNFTVKCKRSHHPRMGAPNAGWVGYNRPLSTRGWLNWHSFCSYPNRYCYGNQLILSRFASDATDHFHSLPWHLTTDWTIVKSFSEY